MKNGKKLLVAGILVLYVCFAAACSGNDKNNNSVTSSGAMDNSGTMNNTNGTMDNTTGNNAGNAVGNEVDDAGNAVGNAVDDVADGVSDITDDLLGGDRTNTGTNR